jgi:hypothetical protein
MDSDRAGLELSSLAAPVGRNIGIATMSTGDSGGAMDYLELSAHLTVRPGCLEGFKKQAAECIRITKEKDTKNAALRLVPQQRWH